MDPAIRSDGPAPAVTRSMPTAAPLGTVGDEPSPPMPTIGVVPAHVPDDARVTARPATAWPVAEGIRSGPTAFLPRITHVHWRLP